MLNNQQIRKSVKIEVIQTYNLGSACLKVCKDPDGKKQKYIADIIHGFLMISWLIRPSEWVPATALPLSVDDVLPTVSDAHNKRTPTSLEVWLAAGHAVTGPAS